MFHISVFVTMEVQLIFTERLIDKKKIGKHRTIVYNIPFSPVVEYTCVKCSRETVSSITALNTHLLLLVLRHTHGHSDDHT